MPHGPQQPNDHPPSPQAMSRETAGTILRRHGLDAEGLASDELKRRWQALARRHHPDLGGDTRSMQEINAAYSFLKLSGSDPVPVPPQPRYDFEAPRFRGLPVWAWAGYTAGVIEPDEVIARDDYTDRNYLKMRMWELSERSTQEWTLWAFDGTDLLPPVVSYGSKAIFPEMAKAMQRLGRRGFRSPRAILAQAQHERYEVLVLHTDGRTLEAPATLFLSDPCGLPRDRTFIMELPGRLDAIAARRGA